MKYFGLIMLLLISACGADVVTTSATVAEGKAQEVKEAQNTRDRVTSNLKNALATGQQQLDSADPNRQ